jgi:DNA-binding transcriptional regulator YdaS (Cro superfamily)
MDIKDIIKVAGGPAALARALGCSHAAVCRWPRVPVARAADVEQITGIPRHVLRPDVWERPERAA